MSLYSWSNYFFISNLLLNEAWKFGICPQSEISATLTWADMFPFYLFGNLFKKMKQIHLSTPSLIKSFKVSAKVSRDL